MKTKDLDQFLMDYQPEGSIIEVDAPWLQEQLRNLLRLEQQNQNLREQVATLKDVVKDKNDIINLYRAITTNRVRLNVI